MSEHARVAMVTTYYHPVLGGAETAARRIAEFLVRRGHSLFVITTLTDASLNRTDTIDGVRVHRIGAPRPRAGARKWTIVPRIAAELRRRRDDYDVIVVIDYRGVGLAAVMMGRLLRRPVVIQAQTEGVLSASNAAPLLAKVGLSPKNPLVRAASWPLRRAYRAADRIACIAKAIRAEALAEGVPGERLLDVPNTVDTARFHPAEPGERDRRRAELGWPLDRLIGIFVGRLSREKGIADLMRAWERLPWKRIHPQALLVVVGPDMPGHPWDEGPAVRELAATSPLAGRVVLFGPTGDPAPLYLAADFAVVPSHWESFGLSAAEAMAGGLPVVASEVGGLTDYIIDGVNGLFVPPHDPDALASAIERVVGDPELRRRLGVAARETAMQFDERTVLERLGVELDRLAGRRP